MKTLIFTLIIFAGFVHANTAPIYKCSAVYQNDEDFDDNGPNQYPVEKLEFNKANIIKGKPSREVYLKSVDGYIAVELGTNGRLIGSASLDQESTPWLNKLTLKIHASLGEIDEILSVTCTR